MPATPLVQTSAQTPEPDLFGIDPANGPDMTAAVIVLRGRVIADAKVQIQGTGPDHKTAAVVSVDLLYEGPGGHTVHVEEVFPLTHRSAADGRAAQLRRGVLAEATYPARALQLVIPHAHSIKPVPAH